MKTETFYLMIGSGRSGKPTAKRVTKTPPTIEGGERVVRLVLDFPDELWNRPAHILQIDPDAEMILAVASEPLA